MLQGGENPTSPPFLAYPKITITIQSQSVYTIWGVAPGIFMPGHLHFTLLLITDQDPFNIADISVEAITDKLPELHTGIKRKLYRTGERL